MLSDPEKRQIYDAYGEEGLKGGAPPPGTPPGAEGFAGFAPGHGGGYQMDEEAARKIVESFFGGGLGSSFGGMGGFGGGGGMGGTRVFTGGAPGQQQQHPFHRSRTAGNFGGMFGGDEYEDEFGGGGGGFGGGPFGGMGSRRGPPPAQKVEIPLVLTLEELYTGTTKRRKVTRSIADAASGRSLPVEETLEIPVKAGWKEGTRVTFEGKGDELPGRPAQDLVFVVRQAPHPRFSREGDDLALTMHLPLTKALTAGTSVDVPSLDNRVLRVPLREVVTPGYVRVVKGEGMPRSRAPGTKGDLKIKFVLDFPKKQLAGEEAATLERLLTGK